MLTMARTRVGSFAGSFSPLTVASPDNRGSGLLTITPSGGFTGQVTITFDRNISGGPVGFTALPSTVQVAAPGSPVTISSTSAVNTPINFTWTSWAVGKYAVIAVLTSGSTTVRVPVGVYVKSTLASVLTWHNDIYRTGRNPLEKILTTANVNTNTFGKLFEHLTNGGIEAQPLFVPSVFINGAYHDVVYVVTMNGYAYAFDANNITGANASPLWTANLGPAAPAGTGGGGDNYAQGAVSTPVIYVGANAMYVLTKNFSSGTAYNLLHALDLSTGQEKFNGPVHVTASVSGTVGGVNGVVQFTPAQQYQRCGLLMMNYTLYIAFGGLYGDPGPCRGWVMAYDPTLHQQAVYTTAPDAGQGSQTAFAGGAIWMSGGGPSGDGTYIYVATGNGDFDANIAGGKDLGDSVIKLDTRGGKLQVADWFTPYNQQALNDQDLDLGSSNPMIIPDQASATPLLMQFGKNGTAYVLNRNSLGHFNSSTDQVVQEFDTATNYHCTPAYYNHAVYTGSDSGPLKAYTIKSTGLVTAPFGVTNTIFDDASPEISYNNTIANNGNTAIVWMIEHSSTAILHAYRADNLSEIFAGDTGAPFIKFTVPTVANGKVYVACEDRLVVFGLK